MKWPKTSSWIISSMLCAPAASLVKYGQHGKEKYIDHSWMVRFDESYDERFVMVLIPQIL